MDLETVKIVGVSAAFKAGEILRRRMGKISEVRKKGFRDLVTEADTEAERAIIETIRARFPQHGILAEESGERCEDPDCRWVIDPLDGTTNFANGLPLYAVSIAFARKGVTLFGAVLNPEAGEMFTAVREKGAELNGQRIRVSNTDTVCDSLLATGFSYAWEEIQEPVMTRWTRCLKASRGVRRLGSAAIDLCYMACGRFEGFWEQNLNPWDTAAGALIAQEAGARVTDFSGNPHSMEMKEILATNGNIHREMLDLLML